MMDVRIDCICPGEVHPEGDTVTLRETLDFRQALAVRKEASMFKEDHPDALVGELLAVLSESYLILGITDWTLVDEQGKPVPATRTEIRERLLTSSEAEVIVEEADRLYAAKVILPLLARASRASRSSPPTPTPSRESGGSTSPETGSSTKPPKRSKRSSTSTTPTDGIEATSTSLVGVSSYSPNSRASAATLD